MGKGVDYIREVSLTQIYLLACHGLYSPKTSVFNVASFTNLHEVLQSEFILQIRKKKPKGVILRPSGGS